MLWSFQNRLFAPPEAGRRTWLLTPPLRGGADAPPGASRQTWLPHPPFWALRPKPRPTFSRRESRQRYARNLLVPGPPAQGGGPPWIPPAFNPSGIGCGSLNLQASSKPRHLPSHGLKTESVSSIEPKEKTRPICSQTQSGKSVYFCGTNPIEGVREPQGERSVPLRGFQRAQPLARLW